MPIFCYKCGRELPLIRRQRKGRHYKGYLCHHCKLSILMLGGLPIFRPPRRRGLLGWPPPKEIAYRAQIVKMFRQRLRKRVMSPESDLPAPVSVYTANVAYDGDDEMRPPVSYLRPIPLAERCTGADYHA